MISDLYQYIIPDTSGIPLAPRIRTQSEITPESIRLAMNRWISYDMRFRQLYYAYVGLKPADLALITLGEDAQKDEAVMSNFCRYIVESLKGYIVGNPPEYECAEGDTFGTAILDLFRKQNKSQVDADLIQDMSTFGRAFELVYLGDDGTPKSTVVSPRDAFVAYSGDVEQDSIFGAVRYAEPHDDGTTSYRLYLYTAYDVQQWTSESQEGPWNLESAEPHPFGRVPLIEYANNKEYMGDFESIIALQNMYNRTLLNRVADKDAFVKSILMISGSVLGMTPDEVKTSLGVLKDNRVLQFDNDGSTASYLEKSMDETGVQVLQDQIKNDIHKFSMVPDLSDEQFANNASGIAMEYKMFGTNQMVANKAIQFQKGFTRRCKLYDAALNNPMGDGEASADISAMHIIFRINTPQDLATLAPPLTQLVQAGIVSKDTARRAVALVRDADAEGEAVGKEADEQAERNRMAFESDFEMPPKMDVSEEDEDESAR